MEDDPKGAEPAAPAADAAEPVPANVAGDSQPAPPAPVAPATEDASSSIGGDGPDSDAHTASLLDELESLIHRAEHFENAGIGKLRAAGLDLVARIKAGADRLTIQIDCDPAPAIESLGMLKKAAEEAAATLAKLGDFEHGGINISIAGSMALVEVKPVAQ